MDEVVIFIILQKEANYLTKDFKIRVFFIQLIIVSYVAAVVAILLNYRFTNDVLASFKIFNLSIISLKYKPAQKKIIIVSMEVSF